MLGTLILAFCVFVGLAKFGPKPVKRWIHSRILFPMMYMAYVNTPIGPIVHSKELQSSRSKPPHSNTDTIIDCGSFLVAVIPFLSDNLAYLIIDVETGICGAVDPADPLAVDSCLQALVEAHSRGEGLVARLRRPPQLQFVLTTHKHLDHSGGNLEILKKIPTCTVVGGLLDSVPGATLQVNQGDIVNVGETALNILNVPCHTVGSIAYHIPSTSPASPGALFTGDTLFSGGVGKFFEGSARQMLTSLDSLANLPGATLMFPGHEMTVSNLEFGVFVEPETAPIRQRLEWARGQRQRHLVTVPSTLEEELATNVFLRLDQPDVEALTGVADLHTRDKRVTALTKLRSLKDNFPAK